MQLMWWKMEKMVMETDLDLNGKRLFNYNPKSKTVIFGQYDKESETIRINNETDYHVFGFDFTVKKIQFILQFVMALLFL